MLKSLSIQHFALIQKTQLRPHERFTAITGETGAGKSLLIETLGLLTGTRADTSHVQSGQKFASIEGLFCVENNLSASNWLKLNGFGDQPNCLVKRVIEANGKSKAFINNQACTLQTLKQLGPLLVSIHAQHQYHTLLDKEKQLRCLDQYAGLTHQREKTEQAYHTWRDTICELQRAKSNYQLAKQRFDLLQYQTQELSEVELSEKSIQSAYDRHQHLNHAESTLMLCQEVEDIASGDHDQSLQALTQTAIRKLSSSRIKLAPLDEAAKLLQEQKILLEECSNHLQEAQQLLEHDPQALAELNHYLDQIGALARKHQVTPESLPALSAALEQELKQLSENDLNLEALKNRAVEAGQQYLQLAHHLSRARQQGAKKLSKSLTQYIHELGMPEAKLVFEFEKDNDTLSLITQNLLEGISLASPNGIDCGELMFTPHLHMPATPLRKTASGGELSRISLALFMLCQQGTNPLQNQPGSLLVFDEVDTGMGGQTGDLLAKHLKQLSNKHQIVCITHLPQIAARSDKHIYVAKSSDKKTTASQAQELNQQERQDELARMLGLATLPKSLMNAATSHWEAIANVNG